MEAEVLKVAASQGFFAVLFTALLFWVLKENAKREDLYQETIDKLATALKKVDNIEENVCKILDRVKG